MEHSNKKPTEKKYLYGLTFEVDGTSLSKPVWYDTPSGVCTDLKHFLRTFPCEGQFHVEVQEVDQ